MHIKKFFLENIGQRQTIIKNTFWLGLAEIISGLLRLILLIYVARFLGANKYGEFMFATAFIMLLGSMGDFGISQITTRQLAQEDKKDYGSIVSLRIFLSLATIVVITIGSFFISADYQIRNIIWILGIYIAVSNFCDIFFAFFRAHQKMQYEAWSKIIQALVTTGLGIALIMLFSNTQSLAYSYVLATIISLIIIAIFFLKKEGNIPIKINKTIWKKYLLMAWPLGLMAICAAVYTYIDSTMMGAMGQVTQTGWYNAAYKIINIVLIPSTLISQSFYPILSKNFKESKDKLQKTYDKEMGITIFLIAPLIVGGIVLAPKILTFFYNPTFLPAVLAFQILIIMAGVIFINTVLNQVLIVTHKQKKIFIISLIGAITNVVLNIVLIPRFSLYGAAASTAITYLILLLLTYLAMSRITDTKPINIKIFINLLISIFASFLMFLAIKIPFIYSIHILLIVLIGAIIYSLAFIIGKTIEKKANHYFKYVRNR